MNKGDINPEKDKTNKDTYRSGSALNPFGESQNDQSSGSNSTEESNWNTNPVDPGKISKGKSDNPNDEDEYDVMEDEDEVL